MDPDIHHLGSVYPSEPQPQSVPHNPKLRKRTKTGCLTCRKRRIKCGEERPTCTNCHKSKRHCEGYTQRVIFRAPMSQHPIGHDISQTQLAFHRGTLPGQDTHALPPASLSMHNGQFTFAQPSFGYEHYGEVHQAVPITPITPVTPLTAGPFAPFGVNETSLYVQQHMPHANWQGAQEPVFPHPQQHQHQSSMGQFNTSLPQMPQYSMISQPSETKAAIFSPLAQKFTPQYEISQTAHGTMHLPFNVTGHIPVVSSGQQVQARQDLDSDLRNTKPHPEEMNYPSEIPKRIKLESMDHSVAKYQHVASLQFDSPNSTIQWSNPSHQGESEGNYGQAHPQNPLQPDAYRPVYEDILLTKGVPENLIIDNSNELLQGAAIETQDDDYHDYDPDIDDRLAIMEPRDELILMRKIHQEHTSSSSMRRYDAFIYPGVLDHYHAEYNASPLKNPRTARVFAHFVCATAPSLGIFERTPRNTEVLFGSWPRSQAQNQSLWTFQLPMRALKNQGLLHAMLALASLHIANLQGADGTPSMKHYSFALKWVHKAVNSDGKRHRVETLAATLLLGYYEVMTADHAKWCSHLLGAKQLLNEIGYPSLTKEARRMRMRERQMPSQLAIYGPYAFQPQPQLAQTSSVPANDINEALVSKITGRHLKYDEYGQVLELDASSTGWQDLGSSQHEQVDLDSYDLYQDLWWWFLRQDAYQSIVSGNSLLLTYSRWSDCPPRACMGRSDAAYGGHDHIMLMLGRIAAFSSRDRRRKMRYIKANGGAWSPPPKGFFEGLGQMPRPPGMGPPQGQGMPPVNQAPSTAAAASSRHYGPGGQQQPYGSSRPASTLAMPPSPQSFVVNSQMQGAPLGPSSGAYGGPPRSAAPQTPTQVPFMGMAPASERQWMPSSYNSSHPANNTTSPTSSDESSTEEDALKTALLDWMSIKEALETLRKHFEPWFMPTDPWPDARSEQPFGPAIHYLQFDIAVLNTLYNLCYIIICRAHPSMPPASMIASGVASPFTKDSAEQIGRIATGIFNQALSQLTTTRLQSNGTPNDTIPGLNPSIGGMLCEITMPLFFAGVQYTDPQQRRWLVDHLHEVEVRCGWATAGMIGHGCETAWRRQAAAQRGPPYTRCGHWGKPDADDGIASPPPWSYGVRGGESDGPPPTGSSALYGLQGSATEGLPTRSKTMNSALARDSRIARGGGGVLDAGDGEGDGVNVAAGIADDHGARAYHASGVISDQINENQR